MTYNPWPENNQPARFDDIVQPVVDAIMFAYDMRRKNAYRNIPWSGFNVGERTLVGDWGPAEKLRVSRLRGQLEDQGRDALEIIVGIAVQLGIEQGRRITITDSNVCVSLAFLKARMAAGRVIDELQRGVEEAQ